MGNVKHVLSELASAHPCKSGGKLEPAKRPHPPRAMVKTAAIRNLGPGAPACQTKPRAFEPANLASPRPRAGKACPSHQQAAHLHTCQWWRSRLWSSSYPMARVFRRTRSNIYFVRTPKCSRRIQVNEKGHRPALTSLNETRFLSCKPGECGWTRAGSGNTKKAPCECMAPRSPMAEPKIKGMTTYLQSACALHSSNWPVGPTPRG